MMNTNVTPIKADQSVNVNEATTTTKSRPRSCAEIDAASADLDARLLALYCEYLGGVDYFASPGDAILSLQRHVGDMVRNYGHFPSTDERMAQARLRRSLATISKTAAPRAVDA